jgi:hypothetical protein
MTPGAPPRFAVETPDGRVFYCYAHDVGCASIAFVLAKVPRGKVRPADERDVARVVQDGRVGS